MPNVGILFKGQRAVAEQRRSDFEKKRFTNDALGQSWIIEGCDQVLQRLDNDTLIPNNLLEWASDKVQSLANVTWQAGRDKVVDEVVSALAPAPATPVQ